MKSVTYTLFLMLGISLMWVVSCKQEMKEEQTVVNLDQPGYITTGDVIRFQFSELPSIQKNEDSVNIPESELSILDSVVAYLSGNPGEMLHISGYYSAQEDTIQGFENLGIARATFLAGLLQERGVDPGRISTQGVMQDLSFDTEDRLQDGYRLVFRKQEIKQAGAFDRTVYFWAAEKLMTYDAELKDYIPAVQKYMQEQPQVKMVLTGHTDYNGNHLLGKMRAESLAGYFAMYGIDTSRVIIRSEGPDKPVAPNDTQENKQKNRRVEITFE
ncbi:MAG TPA: OmpA family protein [Bacteroidales bacterium]|nr:OmpA family protein [Bacteroidales bacterium]